VPQEGPQPSGGQHLLGFELLECADSGEPDPVGEAERREICPDIGLSPAD
jgi:hypothetical protein